MATSDKETSDNEITIQSSVNRIADKYLPKLPTPVPFDNPDIEVFLEQFNEWFEELNIPDTVILLHARLALSVDAKQWLRESGHNVTLWKEFSQVLRAKYITPQIIGSAKASFYSRKQSYDEEAMAFIKDLKKFAKTEGLTDVEVLSQGLNWSCPTTTAICW
jgi:hypothetical protein